MSPDSRVSAGQRSALSGLHWAERLNERLFDPARAVLVLDRENRSIAQIADLAAAQAVLATQPRAASLAGWLVPSARGVDIDPPRALAEAGVAAAEQIRDWCEAHGQPYLVIRSGRPGGRHVIAVLVEELRAQWERVCAAAAVDHGLPERAVDVRDCLRLVGAPHRYGLPAGVLEGTLDVADLPCLSTAARVDRRPRRERRAVDHPRPELLTPMRPRRSDASSSEDAWGDVLAMIRAGYDVAAAWAQIGSCAVTRRGYEAFVRFLYVPARAVVDAEDGLDEAAAWRNALAADPSVAGRRARWTTCWASAVEQAHDMKRPRRRPWRPRIERERSVWGTGLTAEQRAQQRVLADRYQLALRLAVTELAAATGRRADAVRTQLAVVDALVPALVVREGAIAQRTWCVRAGLWRGTLTRHLDALVEGGVLYRAGRYQGGATDSDRWALGPATQAILARLALSESTSTSGTPPHPLSALPLHSGGAARAVIRAVYRVEQALWGIRCAVVAAAESAGTRLAACTALVARKARSLWHQRRWWEGLSERQQQARIARRAALISGLGPIERSAWISWLGARADYAAAAARITTGTSSTSHGDRIDHDYLAAAPMTLYRGMLDPAWRTGGTPDRRQSARHLTIEVTA